MNQKKSNRIFIRKELATKVILDSRETGPYKLRRRLGFKQYDVILTTTTTTATATTTTTTATTTTTTKSSADEKKV